MRSALVAAALLLALWLVPSSLADALPPPCGPCPNLTLVVTKPASYWASVRVRLLHHVALKKTRLAPALNEPPTPTEHVRFDHTKTFKGNPAVRIRAATVARMKQGLH